MASHVTSERSKRAKTENRTLVQSNPMTEFHKLRAVGSFPTSWLGGSLDPSSMRVEDDKDLEEVVEGP